jgi:hypothetical protein
VRLKEIEEERIKQFYYDLFLRLVKWGCQNLICDLYRYTKDNDNIWTSEIQKSNVVLDNIATLDFNEYNNLQFVSKIDDSMEDDPHAIKTKILMKYGYSNLLYSKYQNEARFKRFVYNNYYIKNCSKNVYHRLSNLTLYNLRSVIYRMTETNHSNIEDKQSIFLKEHTTKDRDKFLIWLCSCYVFFKIIDNTIIGEDLLTEIETEPINSKNLYDLKYTRALEIILECKTGLINQIHGKDLESEIKKIQPLTDFLIHTKVINLNDDSKYKSIIDHALNYFYLPNSLITISGGLGITIQRRGIPLRFVNNIYKIDKNDLNMTNNDYDDIINHIHNERAYITNMNIPFNLNYMAKIKAFPFFIG